MSHTQSFLINSITYFYFWISHRLCELYTLGAQAWSPRHSQCTQHLLRLLHSNQSLKSRANNIGIPEAYSRTKINNDNKASVQWAASVTSKVIKNLNLQENMAQEFHQSKYVEVEHISGIINPSNIFRKEMRDNTHLSNIIASMMVSLQAFLKYSHNFPTRIISANKILPYYSIRSEHIDPDSLELKTVVPEHFVPNILELQSGVRPTV